MLRKFVKLFVVQSRCAAVLFIDGKRYYTDGVPNDVIMSHFQSRNDRWVAVQLVCWLGCVLVGRQITTLEILAISVGLSTFQDLLRRRKVVVWTDNRVRKARPETAAQNRGTIAGWSMRFGYTRCRIARM